MDKIEAVKTLVEAGMCIEYRGRHIYKRGKSGYSVLRYSGEKYELTMSADVQTMDEALGLFKDEVNL